MRGTDEVAAKVRTRLEGSWAAAIVHELTPRGVTSLTPSRAAGPETRPGAGHDAEQDAQPAAGQAAGPVERSPWPHKVPLGKVASADLQRDFATYIRQLPDWRQWAQQQRVELVYGPRMVSGTRQEVLTHVLVPDIDTAAHVAGNPWPADLATARARAAELGSRFPHQPNLVAAVRAATRLSDVDFDIACRVCDWYLTRAPTTAQQPVTPRQMPIEGVHAKWLGDHQGLVRTITGITDLGLLPPHPGRFHFTYLDPHYRAGTTRGTSNRADNEAGNGAGERARVVEPGRLHDSYSAGDTLTLPYTPDVIVISENKDTAIGFPPVPGGIAIEGEGRGAGTISSAAWVQAAPAIVYWGDIDIDGLEILNEFRASGLRVESILMDTDTYLRYQRYGTEHDRRGRPLTVRPPREVPHLRPAERDLYDHLTSRTATVLRVEQERIPLDVALEHLHQALARLATET
jgi:hypothetical protein